MGSPTSPMLADLVLEDLEEVVLQKWSFKIHSYYRYVDDTFLIIPNNIPCRNCPICFQVPIWARSDFPHVAAGGHMVWPGWEPHRIMIDKIIFEFCVVLILYSDYIDIKMPKAKSTWRVRKYFFINGNLKIKW